MWPERNANGKYEDHRNNEFASTAAMVRHWNVTYSAFTSRIKRGLSLREALETRSPKQVEWTDHLGRKYDTGYEMAQAWGISPAAFYSRIQNGKTVEEALTKPSAGRPHTGCRDHLGQEFPNASERARHWGLEPHIVAHRMSRNHWPLEKALTTPICSDECTDHLGKTHPSIRAMVDAWGVSLMTYYTKKRAGVPLKEILEAECRRTTPCTDGCGNTFPSKLARSMYWHATTATLETLEDADIKAENLHWRVGWQRGGIMPVEDYGPFLLAEYNGTDYMLSREGFHALLCRDALDRVNEKYSGDPRTAWLQYVIREGARNASDNLNESGGPAMPRPRGKPEDPVPGAARKRPKRRAKNKNASAPPTEGQERGRSARGTEPGQQKDI